MKKFRLKVYVRGAAVLQPSGEVRKLDHRLFTYRKIVRGKLMYTPIPPASLRGALRHAAYIAARVLGENYSEAYVSLFGSDPRLGEGRDTPVTRRGKIVVTLEEGLTLEELRKLTEVRPRISIDARYGTVRERALMFYEAISEVKDSNGLKPLVYSIDFIEEPTEEELRLFRAAIGLLRGWGIGGLSSLGFGLVERIECEEV
ncbi:MAG: hypothetical protein DRN04_08880 [Thermoprotei archaeon]|nr:MAG: hypothetical protein DRN04_08880 [Thermoprotei archaeon]